jgi:hypothetical protein
MTINLSSPESVGMCSARMARIKNEMQQDVIR